MVFSNALFIAAPAPPLTTSVTPVTEEFGDAFRLNTFENSLMATGLSW